MNIAGCPGLEDKMRVAIITASDAGAAGTREDLSGVEIRRILEAAGYTVTAQLLLPDEREELAQAMKAIADDGRAELILTTGGTRTLAAGCNAGGHTGCGGANGAGHCRGHAGLQHAVYAQGHAQPCGQCDPGQT